MSFVWPIDSSPLTWNSFEKVLSFDELNKKAEKFAREDQTLLKNIKSKLNDPNFQKNPDKYLDDLISAYCCFDKTPLEIRILNFFLLYVNSYKLEFPGDANISQNVNIASEKLCENSSSDY